ncbi:MAG: hypothetical protein RIB46_02990 [Pseudomonadales bacterium]
MSNPKRPANPGTSALLGDLESIRSLLQPPDGEEPEDEVPDDEVPLLEDVVHGGVSVNESFLSGEGDFTASEDSSGLNEDLFKALLSDDWRDSARDLLDQARAAIEQHQNEWTPAHTDELNQALKVRIDETLQAWLRDLVQSRMDDLRATLLAAMEREIEDVVSARLLDQNSNEDRRGV